MSNLLFLSELALEPLGWPQLIHLYEQTQAVPSLPKLPSIKVLHLSIYDFWFLLFEVRQMRQNNRVSYFCKLFFSTITVMFPMVEEFSLRMLDSGMNRTDLKEFEEQLKHEFVNLRKCVLTIN